MKQIKFNSKNKTALITEVWEGIEISTLWKGYIMSNLPQDFGTHAGAWQWFNYKGLTYIQQ